MAERLSDPMAKSNVSAATYLGFEREHMALESELGEALSACRNIRKRIKNLRTRMETEGLDLLAYDRARHDAEMPGIDREIMVKQHASFLAFKRKPVGFQPTLDLNGSAADVEAMHDAAIADAEVAGYKAGLDGDRADRNPWPAGSEEFAAWHTEWNHGQADKVAAMPEGGEAKKVGRPRGSKNKPKDGAQPTA